MNMGIEWEWEIDHRVILINNRHGTCSTNPVIGSQWACTGTIVQINSEYNDENYITVNWDNGAQNVYGRDDIELKDTTASRCKSIW